MNDANEVLLFSYGTLRQPEVQLATFGRLLAGRDAAVVGYRLDWLTITDPAVIATSGCDRHPLLVADPTADPVSGTVFEITSDELLAADEYEVDDYERVLVPLDSGDEAWVYVFAAGGLPA
ncbi:gamma-glutamylcyclotransferase [Herbiconiux sp. CPCC 205763]|uniref:Gamma-glutamylcyclotransferase n=1 Tax=Herbiconiux aconitum TaxID=2970913 RepID=A0ABT2GSY7_9MICO|nr:gamma-glutamylcyclotransferase family protein [Herbiconiux aconitum]MCS5717961.1 gamma-glutamylcyclotransferase [Herbiconiux aconitum]